MAYYPKYTGSSTSIATALSAVGVNSSYAHRKEIAAANNIANYSGTAAQNTQMLNLLKQGKLVKAGSSAEPTSSSTTTTQSAQQTQPVQTYVQTAQQQQPASSSTNSATPMVIVKNEDGSDIYFKACSSSQLSIDNALRSIGESAWANYAGRKAIAAANGWTSYSGTAAQNTSMLNMLKKGTLKRPSGSASASAATSTPTNPSSRTSQTSTPATKQTTTSASTTNSYVPVVTTTPTQPKTESENQSNNPIKKFFMQLTDKQKKALKIGAVVVGVGLVGFAAYKATKKSASSSAAAVGSGKAAKAALNGVSKHRRKKKSSAKRHKGRGTKKVNLV